MIPDDESLHQLLLSLDPASSIENRLRVLEQLIFYWLGPCPEGEAYSRFEIAKFPMPYPMKRMYAVLGRRTWADSALVHLTNPEMIEIEADGRVAIAAENQWVWHWLTEIEGQDPPVYSNIQDPSTFERLDESLSEFLIQFMLFGFVTNAPVTFAACNVTDADAERFVRRFEQLPLPLFMEPTWPYAYYAVPGAFAIATRGQHRNDLYFGAKGRESCHLLNDTGEVIWEEW